MKNKMFFYPRQYCNPSSPSLKRIPHGVGPEFSRQMNLELVQKKKQLAAVRKVGALLVSCENLGHFFSRVVDVLKDIRPIIRFALYIFDAEKQGLRLSFDYRNKDVSDDNRRTSDDRLQENTSAIFRAVELGKNVYCVEEKPRDPHRKITVGGDNLSATFAVPLFGASGCVGAVSLHGVGCIPYESRETLDLLSPMIASAVDCKYSRQQLAINLERAESERSIISKADKLASLSSIVATIAHEIKNPMTSIHTFLQLLPDRYHDKAFRNEFRNIALEETQRVIRLVSDLMDLTNCEKKGPENVDLHRMIDRILSILKHPLRQKMILLQYHYDRSIGQVHVCREKIRQALLNIVMNAVAFTPENGSIRLKTRKCRKANGCATIFIFVEDTGPGVAPDLMEKIFKANFSTRPVNESADGYGLGLFVASKNIQDHGGFIRVRNRKEGGVVFILAFPEEATSMKRS